MKSRCQRYTSRTPNRNIQPCTQNRGAASRKRACAITRRSINWLSSWKSQVAQRERHRQSRRGLLRSRRLPKPAAELGVGEFESLGVRMNAGNGSIVIGRVAAPALAAKVRTAAGKVITPPPPPPPPPP